MSDAQLRLLKRVAFHGGPEEQAAVIRRQIRLDLLCIQKVQQSAYLGDEASRLVLGNSCFQCDGSGGNVVECSYCNGSGSASHIGFFDWSKNLEKVGAQREKVECKKHADCNCHALDPNWLTLSIPDHIFLIRCAIAAARCAYNTNPIVDGMRIHAGIGKKSARYRILTALATAEVWLECPCKEHLQIVQQTRVHFDNGMLGLLPVHREQWWACAIMMIANDSILEFGLALAASVEISNEIEIRRSIKEKVVPWLLNTT